MNQCAQTQLLGNLNGTSSELLWIRGVINNKVTNVTVDSCASLSAMTWSQWDNLGQPPLFHTDEVLYDASNAQLTMYKPRDYGGRRV